MVWNFLKAYIFSKRSGSVIRIIGWISFLGITTAVMAMVVVISVMSGFGKGIRERLLAVEPHLVVASRDGTPLSDVLKRVESRAGVTANIFESQDVMIRTIDGLYSGAAARGVAPSRIHSILKKLETRKVGDGLSEREFHESSYNLGKGEVIIGIDLATALAIFPGDELTVISPEALLLPAGEVPKFEKVRVKSTIRTNVPQIDGQVIYYGVGQTFRSLLYGGQADRSVEIQLQNPNAFQEIKRELESAGWSVKSWLDRNSALFFSLRMEKFLMTLFLSLTFLVGSFSVVTLLVLLSTQKRRDMGMLQAMGFSRGRVKRLFTKMGILLSSIGMGAGLILGLAFCWWIEQSKMLKLPDIYYDTELPVDVDWVTIAAVLGGVLVVSAVSSALASRQSANIDPVTALRK